VSAEPIQRTTASANDTSAGATRGVRFRPLAHSLLLRNRRRDSGDGMTIVKTAVRRAPLRAPRLAAALGLAAADGAKHPTRIDNGTIAFNRGPADGPAVGVFASGLPRSHGATDIGACERRAGVLDDRVFVTGFELGCDEQAGVFARHPHLA
jgi:hypothetical protein